MKIKLLDVNPFIEGLHPENLSFKNSQSYAIIKHNKVMYLKVKEYEFMNVHNSTKTYEPFSNFELRRLSDGYEVKGYKFSNYQLKFTEIDQIKNDWFYVDIDCWGNLVIQFYKGNTWLNVSNIHNLIYGLIGLLIGSIGTFLLTN